VVSTTVDICGAVCLHIGGTEGIAKGDIVPCKKVQGNNREVL
jgi:hypothetical protein